MSRILSLFILCIFLSSSLVSQSIYYEKLLERKVNTAITLYTKGIPDQTLKAKEILKKQSTAGMYDKKNKKTGKWTEYILDTTYMGMQYSAEVNGTSLVLHIDGNIVKYEGEYANGLREGEWKGWINMNSAEPLEWELNEIAHYKNGKKNGLLKKYYEYPYLAYEIYFTNEMEDTVRYYFPKRVLMKEMVRSGEMFKIEKEFYSSGKVKIMKKNAAVNGKKLQKLFYYTEGGILVEESIVNSSGKYDGEVKRYSDKGVLKTVGFYTDTIAYGNWKEYYDNGKLKFECNIQNDKLDGRYTFYHPNGQLWTERLFKDGKLWKLISNFDSAGKQVDKGTLNEGTGTVKTYDGDGNLVKEAMYKDGYEQK